MPVKQVRVLTLDGGANNEHILYKLQKGWVLRFALGPTLQASPVRIFCNHPKKGEVFKRDVYQEVHWKCPTESKVDRHDVYAEINIYIAGSFKYYFTADGSSVQRNCDGQGYFLVDPKISFTPMDERNRGDEDDDEDDGDELTLDCIQCQTVLTKLLGPFDQWEGRLQVAMETGYNMIHFTPIQELGQSNSAYSLRDQLHLSPVYSPGDKKYDYKDVEALVKKMAKEWKVLSLTDLVYNHTANDSPWLKEHPECGYNLQNSPYLKPAYLVDCILRHFSLDVGGGKFTHRGLPHIVDSNQHLEMMSHILPEIFGQHRMHEFYTVDVNAVVKDFRRAILENRQIHVTKPFLEIIQDPEYRRNMSTVDMDTALRIYNTDRPGVTSRDERIKACCEEFRKKLEELNKRKMSELAGHIEVAISNFIANAKYRFVDGHGPRYGEVTEKNPLMYNYFVAPDGYHGTVESEEATMYGDTAQYIMAVNGWVMGDDPLRNFADPDRTVYLRRELLPWGDSCKLRYGKKPEDCPFLWEHMRKYTEETARIFHGVRLDNCHSTPLWVAEYMLDAARKVQPDLYVVAELFTGNEGLDNLFMNKLGINSLIREALSAHDSHELGRLVHKFGGTSVGSFIQPRVRPLLPCTAHALFFDQTHDNESPVEKRSVYDMFPSAALVSMACCASGSNRGYDQLVPHHIHVVTEDRLYPSWCTWDLPDSSHMNKTFGITEGKRYLNRLHYNLGKNGFTEVFVDQLSHDTVAVTRHNPLSHDSVLMIARTAFHKPDNPNHLYQVRPVTVEGQVEEVLFEASFKETKGYDYVKNEEYINGLPNYCLTSRENLRPEQSQIVHTYLSEDDNRTQVVCTQLTPGSVVILRTSLHQKAKDAIKDVRQRVSQFGYLMRSYSGRTMFDENFDKSNFHSIVSRLSFSDLNRVLYRCDSEERADGNGFGSYDVPGCGAFVYCGLRGVLSMLGEIRPKNDLGHPLCNNLREGDWLPAYIANRLKVHPSTADLGNWFEQIFSSLKHVPRFLIPCYFDAIMAGAYVVIRNHALQLMSDFVRDGSSFAQYLAMGSVEFCGFVADAKLPHLSPNIKQPKPPTVEDQSKDGEGMVEATLSLAAGFPHFASGYMRSWGRDTFISLRGLLLLTGRFQEARYIILAYGGCLRHGLLPNLLSEGSGARYNCRDAVWWWLQSIQDYCKMVENGTDILDDKVSRLYPTDDAPVTTEPGKYDQLLYDVIQEALQRHAEGLKYRERNAGLAIDSNMSDQGFDNEIGVRWDKGFIFGGNQWNCGTWMDKMGSSERADNKGKPATPRNGSAVELVGLSKSALRWLQEMHKTGKYPYNSVSAFVEGQEKEVTYKEWGDLIQENFEKCYWISTMVEPENESHPGAYQSSYHAPELFTPKNAWNALVEVTELLQGPLGMKTLDPKDWSYCPDYNNADDSSDPKVAHGFNYHNGPEWVWIMGYFLRAKLHFAKVLDKDRPGRLRQTVNEIKTCLTKHYAAILHSPWRSLPELTNNNGNYCRDSCPAQAWSVACILEVLYDLEQIADTDELGVRAKQKGDQVAERTINV
ncbi:hypothetical protein FSP39_020658 [Pinctada imbricata]|uniref:Glycogen debranching enzyme n=1 Tax=Pinctada imbricata TaxID=66713 RepID=A0AA88Y0N9_PINIB|nr:hypothetical protein FSP39_020658 [Pinctada imbricata]